MNVQRLFSMSVAVVAFGAGVVPAAGAEAAATCSPRANLYATATALDGYGYAICRPGVGGEPGIEDHPVSIQRVDPSTGIWYTLATRVYKVTYTCLGTATNTYRASTPYKVSDPITVPCG